MGRNFQSLGFDVSRSMIDVIWHAFFFSIIRDLGQNVLLCTKLALTSSDLKDSKLYRSWPVECDIPIELQQFLLV